ncbi:hypothetical protein ASE01_06190 [Nocardioides sp. Root190]|uniref:ketopantoate reductase family protein n=1 Tax=Nocardioides sp. Root190 TaxID=1736488 RepID=UPI0006FDBB46|nr:2-dehydropantoate 2-reductase [Nocardioides sp. Root190]KRB77780.1 hypothetical protein ASE01_06190 [Nocardioides sp. Root190]
MAPPRHVLVIGAGAIGGLVAARLAENPRLSVTLGSRSPLPGLRFSEAGPDPVDVRIALDPDGVPPADWVVVATKAYDATGLGRWLGAPCCAGARFAVAQNGVDQVERIARFVDPARVVPAIVTYGAERPAPGEVLQTLAGLVRVPAGSLGEDFAALARGSSLEVEVVDDFVTALWSKLVLNLVSNSLTTLADVAVQEVARRPALRRIADDLILECCLVGRQVGADLDPDRFRRMVDSFADFPDALHSSMWQDRQAGRPFEHDAISGVVVREGERHGIDVPVARTVTALLDALSPAPG